MRMARLSASKPRASEPSSRAGKKRKAQSGRARSFLYRGRWAHLVSIQEARHVLAEALNQTSLFAATPRAVGFSDIVRVLVEQRVDVGAVKAAREEASQCQQRGRLPTDQSTQHFRLDE